MSWAPAGSIQFSLLLTSLAATCVSGGLLALEYYGSQRVTRRAPGALGALLATIGVLALLVQQAVGVAIGCTILSVVVLFTWPAYFDGARARIGRLLRPKAIWAVLLGVSLVVSRFLATSVLDSFDHVSPSVTIDLADVPVHTSEAITDKGRPISLFHFKMHSTAEAVQAFIDGNERDRAQLIRLGEANPASNCHGWVFTKGRYGVRDSDVDAILADHDYELVTAPAEGDLAVYSTDEQICHSGIVRIAGANAPILIESKWGPFGVYLHGIASQPFSQTCRFYRTKRADHELAIRPAESTVMSPMLRNRPPH